MKITTCSALGLCFTSTLLVLSGCGGGGKTSAVGGADSSPQLSRSINLVPYRDPWQPARPRFMDIDDRPFSDSYAKRFSYNTAQVTLFYDPTPSTRYFRGKIKASGLKPNFAYQLKLVGKPQFGSRGWRSAGSDFANKAIGLAGRWWNDSRQTSTNGTGDADYKNKYENAPLGQKQSIYGYIFMGDFVTDENGHTEYEFTGAKSYHITWQDKQVSSMQQVVAGTYRIGSTQPPFLGYGQSTPFKDVKLWYEYESGRPKKVKLPVGNYNCRLLITEETFHNPRPDEKGGNWPSVLTTEDFDAYNTPDSNPANDVRFQIR